MRRVQVDAKTASNFMAQGYDVEHFVIIPDPQLNGTGRSAPVGSDTMLTISVDGTPPQKGMAGEVWPKMVKKLWSKDPGAAYTREHLTQVAQELGNTDTSFISYCLTNRKCLRVVDFLDD